MEFPIADTFTDSLARLTGVLRLRTGDYWDGSSRGPYPCRVGSLCGGRSLQMARGACQEAEARNCVLFDTGCCSCCWNGHHHDAH